MEFGAAQPTAHSNKLTALHFNFIDVKIIDALILANPIKIYGNNAVILLGLRHAIEGKVTVARAHEKLLRVVLRIDLEEST